MQRLYHRDNKPNNARLFIGWISQKLVQTPESCQWSSVWRENKTRKWNRVTGEKMDRNWGRYWERIRLTDGLSVFLCLWFSLMDPSGPQREAPGLIWVLMINNRTLWPETHPSQCDSSHQSNKIYTCGVSLTHWIMCSIKQLSHSRYIYSVAVLLLVYIPVLKRDNVWTRTALQCLQGAHYWL